MLTSRDSHFFGREVSFEHDNIALQISPGLRVWEHRRPRRGSHVSSSVPPPTHGEDDHKVMWIRKDKNRRDIRVLFRNGTDFTLTQLVNMSKLRGPDVFIGEGKNLRKVCYIPFVDERDPGDPLAYDTPHTSAVLWSLFLTLHQEAVIMFVKHLCWGNWHTATMIVKEVMEYMSSHFKHDYQTADHMKQLRDDFFDGVQDKWANRGWYVANINTEDTPMAKMLMDDLTLVVDEIQTDLLHSLRQEIAQGIRMFPIANVTLPLPVDSTSPALPGPIQRYADDVLKKASLRPRTPQTKLPTSLYTSYMARRTTMSMLMKIGLYEVESMLKHSGPGQTGRICLPITTMALPCSLIEVELLILSNLGKNYGVRTIPVNVADRITEADDQVLTVHRNNLVDMREHPFKQVHTLVLKHLKGIDNDMGLSCPVADRAPNPPDS